MLWLFKKIADRIKTLLVADAALDLEAEFLARHADRKVELLRKAHQYEEQGLHDLAEELHGQALSLSVENPLSSMLPVIGNIAGETIEADPLKLANPPNTRSDITLQNGATTKMTKTKKTRQTKRR